jgi:hypothetical protein
MKNNLSFKEYLEAKQILKMAGENLPLVKYLYEVRKYCKIPLSDGVSDEKVYVSLKPKDTIEILWEFETPEKPNPKHICLTFDNDQVMYFSWSDAKITKWVETTIHKI